jgi:hypothetical protein
MNKRKVLARALAGSANIRFGDMTALVEAFGFRLSRVSGSHHIFVHADIPELLNLQESGGKANRTRFVSSSALWNAIISR